MSITKSLKGRKSFQYFLSLLPSLPSLLIVLFHVLISLFLCDFVCVFMSISVTAHLEARGQHQVTVLSLLCASQGLLFATCVPSQLVHSLREIHVHLSSHYRSAEITDAHYCVHLLCKVWTSGFCSSHLCTRADTLTNEPSH